MKQDFLHKHFFYPSKKVRASATSPAYPSSPGGRGGDRALEQVNQELKRRTRVARVFPEEQYPLQSDQGALGRNHRGVGSRKYLSVTYNHKPSAQLDAAKTTATNCAVPFFLGVREAVFMGLRLRPAWFSLPWNGTGSLRSPGFRPHGIHSFGFPGLPPACGPLPTGRS